MTKYFKSDNEEYYLFNGKKEGTYKLYYQNSICEIKNYSNGILNGMCYEYFSNGLLQSQYNYNNGKLNGEYKLYYDDGQIYEIYNYCDNVIKGTYKIFNRDGLLVIERFYFSDKIFLDSDGELYFIDN